MKPLETIGDEGKRKRRRLDPSLSDGINREAKKREMEKRLRGEKDVRNEEGESKLGGRNFLEDGWEKDGGCIVKKVLYRGDGARVGWDASDRGLVVCSKKGGFYRFMLHEGDSPIDLGAAPLSISGWSTNDKGVIVRFDNDQSSFAPHEELMGSRFVLYDGDGDPKVLYEGSHSTAGNSWHPCLDGVVIKGAGFPGDSYNFHNDCKSRVIYTDNDAKNWDMWRGAKDGIFVESKTEEGDFIITFFSDSKFSNHPYKSESRCNSWHPCRKGVIVESMHVTSESRGRGSGEAEYNHSFALQEDLIQSEPGVVNVNTIVYAGSDNSDQGYNGHAYFSNGVVIKSGDGEDSVFTAYRVLPREAEE